jgi:hypothetical protein
MNKVLVTVLAVLALFCVGCGNPAPKTVSLNGTYTAQWSGAQANDVPFNFTITTGSDSVCVGSVCSNTTVTGTLPMCGSSTQDFGPFPVTVAAPSFNFSSPSDAPYLISVQGTQSGKSVSGSMSFSQSACGSNSAPWPGTFVGAQ